MKIAVPVTKENQIDGHFGHCESYGVFTISEKNEILGMKNVGSPEGCGCKSDIASVLAADGVTVMLAGGIGGGAINVLNKQRNRSYKRMLRRCCRGCKTISLRFSAR